MSAHIHSLREPIRYKTRTLVWPKFVALETFGFGSPKQCWVLLHHYLILRQSVCYFIYNLALLHRQLYKLVHCSTFTGYPIVLPRESESVLLGAAILGAVAAKKYSSLIEAMKALNAAGQVLLRMSTCYFLHFSGRG